MQHRDRTRPAPPQPRLGAKSRSSRNPGKVGRSDRRAFVLVAPPGRRRPDGLLATRVGKAEELQVRSLNSIGKPYCRGQQPHLLVASRVGSSSATLYTMPYRRTASSRIDSTMACACSGSLTTSASAIATRTTSDSSALSNVVFSEPLEAIVRIDLSPDFESAPPGAVFASGKRLLQRLLASIAGESRSSPGVTPRRNGFSIFAGFVNARHHDLQLLRVGAKHLPIEAVTFVTSEHKAVSGIQTVKLVLAALVGHGFRAA